MLTNSEAEDRVFRALADSHRRRIVAALAAESRPVHAIAAHFRITRPAVSRHLRILRDAGLVGVRTTGRENVYFLRTSTLRMLEDWLNELWTERLLKLKALAEEDTR